MNDPRTPITFSNPEAAEAAFYSAFQQLDLQQMMRVWSSADDIACTHPGAEPLRGVRAVKAGWRAIFGGASGTVDLVVRRIDHWTANDLACHSVIETIADRGAGQSNKRGRVSAINIYRFEADGWRMVLHHGGPLASTTRVPSHGAHGGPGKPRQIH